MTSNMKVVTKVRRFGNSLGVVIPSEEAAKSNLSAGDSVEIEIVRRTSLKELFGSMKFAESAQKMKDEARRGWHD